MKNQKNILPILLLFFFFSNSTAFSIASNTNKISFVLKSFPSEEKQLFSDKLTQVFENYPDFEIVRLDSNFVDSLEVGKIDSVKQFELEKQNIDGLIFSQFIEVHDSQKVDIQVFFPDSTFSELGFETSFYFAISGVALDSLAQKIDSLLVVPEEEPEMLHVLVVQPIDSVESEVSGEMDPLKASLDRVLFDNFQYQVLNLSDSLESSASDSVLLLAGNSLNAGLVLSGKFNSKEDGERMFAPVLLMAKTQIEQNSYLDEMNAIKGKTCRLTKIKFPPLTIENLKPLTNFIAAHFYLQKKNYIKTIQLLKEADNFPGLFYLSESYLNRGVGREKDVALARADWDSSVIYLKKCFDFEITPQDTVFVNNNLGVAFQLLGNLDSATVCFSIANNRLNCLKNHRDRLRVSGNYGNILLLSGNWNQALDIFQASVEDMKIANDSLTLALTYENLGNIYQLIMQRNRAIQYYNQALELRMAMHDDAGAAITLLYLGNAHHERDDYEAAKKYFLQGLGLHRQIHNEPGVADAYDRLGQVFQELGELDSAQFYFKKSIDVLTELEDGIGLVRTMLHQASSYSNQKNYGQAMKLYERALPIANTSEIKSLSAQVYDRMGDIYNNKNQLIAAFDNYDEAADLYEQVGNMESLSLILYNMGLIRLKQNDYGEGYQLMKRAIDLDDKHGFYNLSGEREFLKELQIILDNNPNE